MPLLIICMIFVFLLAEANSNKDHGYITNDSKKWHKWGAVMISLFTLYGAISIAGISLISVLLWFWFLTHYWVFMDIRLNMKRDLPLFYVGNTASIDRFFQRISRKFKISVGIFMLLSKFLLLVVLYILISYTLNSSSSFVIYNFKELYDNN